MKSFFKNFDNFGVTFAPLVDANKSLYKSYIGGLTSIGIYVLTFIYFILVFVDWQQGKMLPSVIRSTQILEYEEYSFEKNPILVKLLTKSLVNPFRLKNNIITPLLYNLTVEGRSQPRLMFDELQQNAGSSSSFLDFSNIKLTYQNGGEIDKTSVQHIFGFFICDSSILADGQNCAPQDEIEQYFKEFTQIELELTVDEFNIKTKKMDTYLKIYQQQLDETLSYFNQVIFATGNAKINNGLLLANQENQKIINSIEYITQTISKGQSMNIFGLQLLMGFQIKLDNVKFELNVQYPMLGAILAQVGSIVSLLMLGREVIIVLNQSQLQKYLVDEIIGYYYPQYQNLCVSRNIRDKITHISSKDKKYSYNISNVSKVIDQARDVAINKLSILNIVYELSRIQFVLQSIQERELIVQSRQVGIGLDLQDYKRIDQVYCGEKFMIQTPTTEILDTNMKLIHEDIKLFINNVQEPYNILQENIKDNQFYQINQIKKQIKQIQNSEGFETNGRDQNN